MKYSRLNKCPFDVNGHMLPGDQKSLIDPHEEKQFIIN
jgi:hypothetical protein